MPFSQRESSKSKKIRNFVYKQTRLDTKQFRKKWVIRDIFNITFRVYLNSDTWKCATTQKSLEERNFFD